MTSSISVKIEFGGGLELLFGNQKSYRIDIPSLVPTDNSTDSTSLSTKEKKPADVVYLIHHMRDHMLKERPELFMEKDTVWVLLFLNQCLLFFVDTGLVNCLQETRNPCIN